MRDPDQFGTDQRPINSLSEDIPGGLRLFVDNGLPLPGEGNVWPPASGRNTPRLPTSRPPSMRSDSRVVACPESHGCQPLRLPNLFPIPRGMSHRRLYGVKVCGRYVIAQDVDAYARFFGVDEIRNEILEVNYNVAPTDPVYGVVDQENRRLLRTFRWGLIPFWAKSPTGGRINARAESVASKAMFRDSFARRRCIIPADGFFEWEQLERGKLPHYIYRKDRSPMGFAGIWSTWRDPESGDRIRSCSIITTNALPSLAPIHDRMPVMLDPAVWDDWLDRTLTDPDLAQTLLRAIPETAIAEHAVSTLVNNVRNNLPECVAALPDRSP